MKFIHSLLLLFFGLWFVDLSGQSLRIIDAITGYPVQDVIAYDTQAKVNTTSDVNGHIDLSVFSPEDQVHFEHIGYESLLFRISELQSSTQLALYPDTQRLGEIVLSVSRTRDEKKRVSKQVAILSDRDIASVVPNTSAELLREAPGVRVQQSQGGGGSPVIRGFEANRILLVVDGVRMNNAIYRSGHLHNAISIDPFSLSRAEVIYGPSSVGYGSDALGGVVHYFTKEPRPGDAQPRRFFIANNYDTRHEHTINHIDITHSKDNWASLTSMSYSFFGDIYMGRKRNHGYADWGLVPEFSKNNRDFYQDQGSANPNPNRQRNTGYDQIDLMQKFVFFFFSENKWVLNLQYSSSSDIPRFDKLVERRDGELRYATWFYGPQKRLLISPKYSFTSDKKWLREGVITLAYQQLEESRVQRKFGSLIRENQIEDLDVFSANADFNVALDQSKKLAYGFEFTHNELQSIGFSQNLVVEGNDVVDLVNYMLIPSRYPSKSGFYTTMAAYIDYKLNLDQKNTINAGARITNTRLKAAWNEQALIDARLGKTTNRSNALNLSLVYVFRPNDLWELRSVLASGFRAPNIDDMGKIREKQGKLTVPNPFLKPEYAYTADFGVSRYFDQRTSFVQLNLFYTLLYNYIARQPYMLPFDDSSSSFETVTHLGDELETWANTNVGEATLRGASLQWNTKVNKNLTYGGHVNYTYGITREDQIPVPSILPWQGAQHISISNRRLNGQLSFVFAGQKLPEDYSNGGEDGLEETPVIGVSSETGENEYAGTPSWNRFDFRLTYNVNTNTKVGADLHNLFDVHYKEFASGISAPGRSLRLRLQYRF